MNIDELLRTEFTSRTQAINAAGGRDVVIIPEMMAPPVKVQDTRMYKWNEPPKEVSYTMRRAVLKEFDFPRGTRWKFCLE